MAFGYDAQGIEKKWQERWAKDGLYSATVSDRPAYYCLEMFPYTSGDLHMGHVRNYAIGDVISRFKRMRGFNVLHPMGWDAFGMPAENAAIERDLHPADWTYGNIRRLRAQLKSMGMSYDWNREVATCHPAYYKWTQWLFLTMYERGLAYKAEANVNWCPTCQTVLANEQVVGGLCWRCDSMVGKRELNQWFFRITEYADRLLEDLDELSGWPEHVRTMQANWIGRSEGAEIDFRLEDDQTGENAVIPVFTTRQDTVFGVTYLVLAPEHPLVRKLIAGSPEEGRIRDFITETLALTTEDRMEAEKKGVFTGRYAVNPVNDERIPIWIANYVLMDYGTGAVMGVPGHDQRDFEFARQNGLPIRVVIQNPERSLESANMTEAYVEYGTMANSGCFDGLPSEEGQAAVADYLEERGWGRRKINYRLRDWLISRQRYWGAPIPIVYCRECGMVPVPEEDLPVELPRDVQLGGRGGSPLERHEGFVRCICPRCGGEARRETDTMDTFLCSSWYYLRYTSARDEDRPFDPEEARYWMPVDQYTGGIEHAVLHLLYSRFVTKVLHDSGWVHVHEPFKDLLTQGMVLKDGGAMSKSRGNVVAPDDIISRYGADTARVFILFASPPEKDLDWSEEGVGGAHRFLLRVWRAVMDFKQDFPSGQGSLPIHPLTEEDSELHRTTHWAIRKVTEDIEERFHFNTALSALMELVNGIYRYREAVREGRNAGILSEALSSLVLMLAPFAPHLSEELWHRLGQVESVHLQTWPEHREEALRRERVTIVIQVDGKVRDRVEVPADIAERELKHLVLSRPRVQEFVDEQRVVRCIVIPRRLVNVVTDG